VQPLAETLPETAAQTVQSTTQSVPAGHWWQSSAIDAFLIGALFVLVVILVVEAINWWRSKREQ
jgi:hypothetical protein